jgi:Thioredoxin
MVREMQPLRGRGLRSFLHLSLLMVLLGALVAATEPGPPAHGSYATTVSAFAVRTRRVLPHLGNPQVRKSVDRVFAGIPQHGPALGDPKAPVTMQLFADPECPQARQFAIQLLPRLVSRWVRGGKLRIEYLGEHAETLWPRVFGRQQIAVEAAGRQGKLWQFLELFYHYQGPEYTRYADAWFLREIAGEIPSLDMARWRAERGAPSLARKVEHDLDFAEARDIRHTPAFSIGPTGGAIKPLLHFTLTEPLAFEAAFKAALAD